MSKYNKDYRERDYFLNINSDALPRQMQMEFNKVKVQYEVISCEFDENYQEIEIGINKDILCKFKELLSDKKLRVTISEMFLFKEPSTIEYGFSKFEHQNLIYFNITGQDYLGWFLKQTYTQGFLEGYNYKFESDFELFHTVFKNNNDQYSNILNKNFKNPVIDFHYLTLYGVEKGKFLSAWNMILKRPFDFERFFEYEKSEVIKPIQWHGKSTELIELIKALIVNGNLKGEQKEIFKSIEKMFNHNLNNIDQAITKFNSRNNDSQTIFINQLKSSFQKYLDNKLEKRKINS